MSEKTFPYKIQGSASDLTKRALTEAIMRGRIKEVDASTLELYGAERYGALRPRNSKEVSPKVEVDIIDVTDEVLKLAKK